MAEQVFVARPVTFHDGETLLAGELTLPERHGPHPALAMIHGSGATDRTNLGFFPPIRDHFVAHGIAVLCFDKPGVGASTGDWTRQRFPDDRVAEALAAVEFLSGCDDVDPGRVGLWGVSQGGWVVPLAAARSGGAVAFVVSVSGPGVSPGTQNVHDVETSMREGGHDEADVRRGVADVSALMRASAADLPFEEVERTILRAAGDAPWRGYFDVSDADQWEFLRRTDMAYDPAVALERVTCPILALFGEHDPRLPVAESVAVFEQSLRRAGNPDATVTVFPGAGHQITVGPDRRFAPGYLETMSAWLTRVIRRAPERQPGTPG